jgi:hypothetical protein
VEARAPLPQDLRNFLTELATIEGQSIDPASEYL